MDSCAASCTSHLDPISENTAQWQPLMLYNPELNSMPSQHESPHHQLPVDRKKSNVSLQYRPLTGVSDLQPACLAGIVSLLSSCCLQI